MDQESSDIQSTIHDDMTDYDCCLKTDEHGHYQSLPLPQYECYLESDVSIKQPFGSYVLK